MALTFAKCNSIVKDRFSQGEGRWIYDDGESTLLTNFCLHLVNETKLEDVIANKNDLFFAEHFILHNIPRTAFEAELKGPNPEDLQKLEAFLGLIHIKIRNPQPLNLRFHDFYINIYRQVLTNDISSDPQRKKFFCNVLLELLKKAAAQGKDIIFTENCFGSWDQFTAACKTYNIDLGSLLKKDIVDLSPALKTDTDNYLALLEAEQKTLSSAASQKSIGDKITVLKKLQSILVKPDLDEKNKALVDFIKDKDSIPTLNQRRYVSRGLLHAGEVFLKSLLLCVALIADIATLATIKFITGTSLTARVHAGLFPVKGEKLTDRLIEHCAPLLKA